MQTQSKCGVNAKQTQSNREANVHLENAFVFQRLCVCSEPAAVLLQTIRTGSYMDNAGGAQVQGAKTWEHAWGADMLETQVSRHAHDLCLVNTMHCVLHII